MEIEVSALGDNRKDVFYYMCSRKKKEKKGKKDMKTQWKSISNGNQIITFIAIPEKLFQSLRS